MQTIKKSVPFLHKRKKAGRMIIMQPAAIHELIEQPDRR